MEHCGLCWCCCSLLHTFDMFLTVFKTVKITRFSKYIPKTRLYTSSTLAGGAQMGLCSFTRLLFRSALLGAARPLSRVSSTRFPLRHAVHRHGDAVADTSGRSSSSASKSRGSGKGTNEDVQGRWKQTRGGTKQHLNSQ